MSDMKAKLDKYEKDILKSYNKGEWKRVENFDEEMAILKESAKKMQKNRRINIRLTPTDLIGIRRLAIKEGLPYQTLISSILHKYLSAHEDQSGYGAAKKHR
jgi:predicted DNA binding CopG/RHH family protein